LTNPDDAVIAQLNPSEDYKTSVLSGLTPTIIMECAGRGLAFYSYQATQEMWVEHDLSGHTQLTLSSVYQGHLAKSLTIKYSNMSSQLDKVINDANAEIASLREKLDGEYPACRLQRR